MDVPGEPRVHRLPNQKKTPRVGRTRPVPIVPCRRTRATGVIMTMHVMPSGVPMGVSQGSTVIRMTDVDEQNRNRFIDSSFLIFQRQPLF